ncbi:DNA binding protein, excisionase family [Candidatus Propionivibrio aalborgensis]|uniref:DNA binding protein, excisionase family n=1 Tax=Candidatus Propionivibrio aalborgensis TaxID=1860101 RepID=A0A1A8Y1U6_9RHOO|nr:helix-turn-helix domain-containing protein [Candidatus Propionivibrio aalborgensis]SBT11129.1 DNA binding protein, excisionase family [Candidatus Propionivibrio aalborgensis]
MKTLTLEEAAGFLKMHPEEVRRRVKCGMLPGAKAGRRWVFLDVDLADWLRSMYSAPRQFLSATLKNEVEKCHSINAERCGGSMLSHPAENEYASLLGLKSKLMPKSFTTS